VRNGEQTTLTVAADVHSSTAGASFDAPQVTRSVETELLSEFNSTEPRPVSANSPLVSDPVLYVNETRASWGAVTNETTELDLTFVVYNPKPYPVGVTEVGYGISMNDVTVGEGATEHGVVVPPGATRTVETTTHVRNGNLDEWWVTHIERNQVSGLEMDFSARLDLRATTVRVPLTGLTYTKTVETDIFGTKSEPEPADTTPSGVEAGTETATETETATPRPPRGTPTSTPTPTSTSSPTPTPDDGGLLGDGGGTETPSSTEPPTPVPTPTPSATPTPTPIPDGGGLLGTYWAAAG
jgi:LEA14-like dessication related protein